MNKIFFVFALLLIYPRLGFSERMTININSNVIERSCTVSKSSSNFTIGLESGDLRNRKVGVPFIEEPFSISIENCSKNTSFAYIKFTGISDEIMDNLLKNNNKTEQGAKAVTIGLYDINKKNIDIKNNRIILNINHSQMYNTFDFFASYVKTSENALPGKITSIVDFEISYD